MFLFHKKQKESPLEVLPYPIESVVPMTIMLVQFWTLSELMNQMKSAGKNHIWAGSNCLLPASKNHLMSASSDEV